MQGKLRVALRAGLVTSALALLAIGCAVDATSGAGDEDTLDESTVTPQAAPTPDSELEIFRPRPDLGEWVQTPIGLTHRSCVYEVGDDAVGEEDGSILRADGTRFTPPDCAHALSEATETMGAEPQKDGWVIARAWSIGSWMKKQRADFGVPKEPVTQGNQLLYFFPGSENLSPSNKVEIIQPVLQWGTSPAGGGKHWGIASWYGGDSTKGNYFHSTLRSASPGDDITGTVASSACTSKGACKWTITTKNTTTGTTTRITSPRIPPQTWVLGGVMEEYGVKHCDQNAGSKIHFSNIEVWNKNGNKVTRSFSQYKWGPASACHSASTASASAATLTYDVKRASGSSCSADKQCKSGSCGTCPYYSGICCK